MFTGPEGCWVNTVTSEAPPTGARRRSAGRKSCWELLEEFNGFDLAHALTGVQHLRSEPGERQESLHEYQFSPVDLAALMSVSEEFTPIFLLSILMM